MSRFLILTFVVVAVLLLAAGKWTVDGLKHITQQLQRSNRATDMATCLNALRNDEIAACRGGFDRLFARADLPTRERTVIVDDLHIFAVRFGVKKLDDPALPCRFFDERTRLEGLPP